MLLLAYGLSLVAVSGGEAAPARGAIGPGHLVIQQGEAFGLGNTAPMSSSSERRGLGRSVLCLRGGWSAYPPRILEGKDLEMLRSIRHREMVEQEKALIGRIRAAKREHRKERREELLKASPPRFHE
jgi:hypothetical protein